MGSAIEPGVRQLSLGVVLVAVMLGLWLGFYLLPLLRRRRGLDPSDEAAKRRYRVSLVSTVAFGALIGMVAILGMALVTSFVLNGADPSKSEATDAEQYPESRVTTLLETRDALNSLGVFTDCPMFEGAVGCFVESPSAEPYSPTRRGVLVFLPRDSGVEACNDFVPDEMPGSHLIVTDNRTFMAYGFMNTTMDSRSFSWPDEVWPEDIQRALGGKVTTVEAWCP